MRFAAAYAIDLAAADVTFVDTRAVVPGRLYQPVDCPLQQQTEGGLVVWAVAQREQQRKQNDEEEEEEAVLVQVAAAQVEGPPSSMMLTVQQFSCWRQPFLSLQTLQRN